MPSAQLQAWERWADRAGVANGELVMAMTKIQRSAAQAADGGGELGATFEALGVKVKNADGSLRGSQELLMDVLDGLAATGDESKRTALAMDVFGRSGGKLLRALGQGDIKEFLASMDEVGTITAESAEEIDVMNDAMTDAKSSFFSLAVTLVTRAAPALRWVADRMREAGRAIAWLVDHTNILQAAMVLFSVGAGVKVLAFISRWIALNRALALSQLKTFALVGVAILLIDELITTWQGGESFIRDAIDAIFGEGTTAKVVESLKKWGEEVAKFFSGLKESGAIGEGAIIALTVLIIGLTAKFVTLAATVGVSVVGSFARLAAGVVSLGARFIALAPAVWAAIAPMLAFALPIAVIVAVGVAVNELVRQFGGWQKVAGDFAFFFEDVWRRISSGASEMWGKITGLFSNGVESLKVALGKIPGVSLLMKAAGIESAPGATSQGGLVGLPGVASVPVSTVASNQTQVAQTVSQSNQISVTVQGDAPKTVGRDIAAAVTPRLSGSLRGASESLSGAY
jgi:hypothetical protein